jgi:VWFA-related protein
MSPCEDTQMVRRHVLIKTTGLILTFLNMRKIIEREAELERRLLSIFLFFIMSASIRAGATRPQVLQHDVSVTLKLIQVYVTDKDGRPVRDLTKEDFTVFDEGKPVVITEFEKYDFLTQGSGAEERAPVEPATTAPAPPPGLNRRFIIFLDFAYNNQKGAAATIKTALHFLDTGMLPDDEVALVSYSAMKGLKVHEYLTRDHAKVRRAVAELSAKEIAGRAEEIEQLYWKAAQDGLDNLAAPARYNLNWRRQEAKSQANNYFSAFTSLAKAMRLVEGQKNVLFFSTGMPYSLIYGSEAGSPSAGKGTILSKSGSTFDMGDPILLPLAEGLLKELSASNCSVFSFDTRESAKIPSLFAYEEMRNVTEGGSAFSAAGVFQSKTDLLRDDRTTGQDSLRRLSKQTGGQYFSNISLYEQNLGTVQNITGTYYVLGYSISAPRDGEFHKIKVGVTRKGCQVQTQAGYFNPKPFRDYTDLEKQIQLFDLALNERSEGRARKEFGVTALTYDAGNGPRLRLVSRIPRETVASFEGGPVEFVALNFDDEGTPVSLERKTADLAGLEGQEVLFTSETTPQPGRYKCRVIIRDLKSGDSAVASAEANVAKPAENGLSLCAPLLLFSGDAPVCLEAGRKALLESPAWKDVYPYDEKSLVPAAGEIPRAACKAVVVVPYTAALGPLNVAFSARLIGMADGQSTLVELTELGRSQFGTVTTARFDFPLDTVPPGRYQLYVYAVDTDRGLQAQTHLPVAIGSTPD